MEPGLSPDCQIPELKLTWYPAEKLSQLTASYPDVHVITAWSQDTRGRRGSLLSPMWVALLLCRGVTLAKRETIAWKGWQPLGQGLQKYSAGYSAWKVLNLNALRWAGSSVWPDTPLLSSQVSYLLVPAYICLVDLCSWEGWGRNGMWKREGGKLGAEWGEVQVSILQRTGTYMYFHLCVLWNTISPLWPPVKCFMNALEGELLVEVEGEVGCYIWVSKLGTKHLWIQGQRWPGACKSLRNIQKP